MRWSSSHHRATAYRAEIAAPARLSCPGESDLLAVTLVCSIGGCSVHAGRPIPEGEVWGMSIGFHDGPVDVTGRVCHCQRTGSGYRVGFEFTRLSPGIEQRIAQIVAAQDRRMSVRVAVAIPMEYRRDRPGEVFAPTATVDIGVGGACFRLSSACEVGDRVELVMAFELDRIALTGTVVRLSVDHEGLYAAVCFDPPSTFRHHDLEMAVRRLLDGYPHLAIRASA